jgi:hypothetical protein
MPNSLIRWAVCRADYSALPTNLYPACEVGTVADPTNLFSLLCYTNILCISQRGGTIPNNKVGKLSLTTAVLKKGVESTVRFRDKIIPTEHCTFVIYLLW